MTEAVVDSISPSNTSILQSRRSIYVGGLADDVSPITLRAAFIPFGPIKSVDIPMDYTKGINKGFAFIEFHDADDAAEAIYNMDGAELLGKILNVCLAQPNQTMSMVNSNKAIWSTDDWYLQNQQQQEQKINLGINDVDET